MRKNQKFFFITNDDQLIRAQNIIKDLTNIFRLEKYSEATQDKIIRDISNLFEFENEEEDYYKPVNVTTFLSNNNTEFESNANRTARLLIKTNL